MEKPAFDRYYRYDEIAALLHRFVDAYPQLAQVDQIGTSHEGRPILALTVTNAATGPHLDKPGFYVDGNIHGSEVTASMTALHFAWSLLSGHGTDAAATRLVDETTTYVIPAVSPDGVEHVLSGAGWVRSGTRCYPYEEERDGLQPGDVDGDGEILSMRIADPGGGWKVSTKDPRLLVPRRFHDTPETGGPFYRVYTEGTIRNFDGVEVAAAPPRQGLDFNRNFPANWKPEVQQGGAGDYPFSEPETRALAQFITARPNICGLHSLHTGMESIIRPPATQTDKEMPQADLRRILEIAEHGKELTGYTQFSYRKLNDDIYVAHGDFATWTFEQLGLIVYCQELWDVRARAGKDYVELDEMRKKADLDGLEEVEAAILKWNDEAIDGEGFVDWHAFEHPQLGPVELGGWKRLYRNNAPPRLLEATCEKVTRFLQAHAQAAPRLRAQLHEKVDLGGGVWRIAVAVRNEGYLPTNVTEQAVKMKTARPLEARLVLGEGCERLVGDERVELGHLEGYGGRRKVEWVVRFGGEPVGQVVVAGERAGVVRVDL